MPRNDRITRQWHLLRRLEGSNGLTLSQLVHSVPDDHPKNARTVRRDLEALEAVGFPIITERRNDQTRWRPRAGTFHGEKSVAQLKQLLRDRYFPVFYFFAIAAGLSTFCGLPAAKARMSSTTTP
jgi:hypothetical protein